MKRNWRFVAGMSPVLLIFCFMVLSCGSGSSPSTLSGEYDATRSIVCLGDSLTAGMINNVDHPEKSWPALLQDKVTVPVFNAGVSGDTTADAIARLEKDVLSKKPQIVIIALGGNDLARTDPNPEKWEASFNAIKDNLQIIISEVKAPNRKLYLVNYMSEAYLSAATEIPAVALTLIHSELAGRYKSLAESNNISLIEDMITAEMSNSHISADGIHLSETGYEMAADIIFDAIKPFLLEHNLVK